MVHYVYTIITMHVFLFVSGFGYFNFKISNLDMYNWDAIAAMNLKITVIILSSFGYTRQEFQAPIHFLCQRAEHLYLPWSKSGCFIPLVW